MIDIFHHGATTGVTGSCHELTLTPGMKKGSDPAGSGPSFSWESLEIIVDSPLAAEFTRIFHSLI